MPCGCGQQALQAKLARPVRAQQRETELLLWHFVCVLALWDLDLASLHASSHDQYLLPRRWIHKLRNKMAKDRRKEFKAAADKVVKRKRRPDGSMAVWAPRFLTKIVLNSPPVLNLKLPNLGLEPATCGETQEYPMAFAKAVATLHLDDVSKVLHNHIPKTSNPKLWRVGEGSAWPYPGWHSSSQLGN